MKNIVIILCLIVFTQILSCTSKANNNSEEKVERYVIFEPLITDTTYYAEYLADISAIKNVEIRARVKGYLEKIHVDEGERVKRNQLLFSISSFEYQEALLQAKSNYRSALADLKAIELELNSTETLLEKEIISETQAEIVRARLAAAQAQVEVAQSQEKDAELNLSYTKVRAPFDGILNRIDYKVGSLIDESTLMTTISDDEEVFAYFNLSEKEYYAFLEEERDGNQKVSLILANGETHSEEGFIETIDGQFDPLTGSISFRARFANPNQVLKHRSTGKVQLTKRLEKVMIIPQKSTFEIQDKVFVYVLDKENKLEMKSIVIAMRLPHLYVIESGLITSDRILFEGIQQVKVSQQIDPELKNLADLLIEL